MFLNPGRSACLPSDRGLIGAAHAVEVRTLLGLCPAHSATPLVEMPTLAVEGGLGRVFLKDEGRRMGHSSFKALGGAYAVALLIMARAAAALGRSVPPEELVSPPVRRVAAGITVVCASAGNHGLSVAAGARAFGARAVVVLSEAVSETFAVRLRAKGALVERAGVTYEESMERATAVAHEHGWVLVSDSSWPGYIQTPLDVMRGYTALFEEAADAIEVAGGPASHVFVQAGVGGLAAAGAGYLRDRWGDDFTFVVVEPEGAPCVLESVRQGRFVRLAGGVTTLGRLDCKEPSLLAFELLSRLADAFMLVSDMEADQAVLRLAGHGAPISACGAAGAAGLFAACRDEGWRASLGLGPRSRVLLIGTESAEPAEGADFSIT